MKNEEKAKKSVRFSGQPAMFIMKEETLTIEITRTTIIISNKRTCFE